MRKRLFLVFKSDGNTLPFASVEVLLGDLIYHGPLKARKRASLLCFEGLIGRHGLYKFLDGLFQ